MSKIKVGLLGFGLAGKVFHEPLISSIKEMEIIKVLSSRVEEVLSVLPCAEVVQNISTILDDDSIDLIINCAHNSVHYSNTKLALESHKHVIVEKPFVMSVEEGRELISLAKKNDLLLSVFHNRRLDSDYLTVKELINNGQFGEIKLFESHFDRYRPVVRSDRWREKKGVGNGILYDLGSHLVDQAIELFGMPNSIIADVCAQKKGGEATDYFHIVFKYTSDLRVILHGSSFGDTSPRFRIEGAKNSFIKYGMDPQEEQSKLGIRPTDKLFGVVGDSSCGRIYSWNGSKRSESSVKIQKGQYIQYYQNIADVINGKSSKLLVTADSALTVVELIELSYQSSREGKEIFL